MMQLPGGIAYISRVTLARLPVNIAMVNGIGWYRQYIENTRFEVARANNSDNLQGVPAPDVVIHSIRGEILERASCRLYCSSGSSRLLMAAVGVRLSVRCAAAALSVCPTNNVKGWSVGSTDVATEI